jgi:hypothetical protein
MDLNDLIDVGPVRGLVRTIPLDQSFSRRDTQSPTGSPLLMSG